MADTPTVATSPDLRRGPAASWPTDPLRALVAPRTWLGAAHVLLDAAFGFATCFLVAFGLFWAVVGLPFALVGVPVWILTAWTSNGLAAIERTRIRLLLGVDLAAQPMPPAQRHPLRYGGVLLRDPGVQRRALHQLLAFPLGLVTSTTLYLWLSGAVTMLVLPVLATVTGTENGRLLGIDVGSAPVRGMLAGLGLLLLVAAPAVVRGLVRLDLVAARALLGPVPGALAQRVGELERSRARVVDSVAAERRRIERDLHDGTQQQLVSLGMTLGRARARYRSDPDGIGDLLDEAHQQAKDAVAELRGLIRGLHPPVLTDRGLDAALSALATRCPVPVDLTVELGTRPSPTVEAIGYFVVAEALTNVARHSRATAAALTVRDSAGSLWITVADNGHGGADPDAGTGLRGLADRVSGVDGQLRIDSPAGGPTVLTIELPCR